MKIQFIKLIILVDGLGRVWSFARHKKYKIADNYARELIALGYAFEYRYMSELIEKPVIFPKKLEVPQ